MPLTYSRRDFVCASLLFGPAIRLASAARSATGSLVSRLGIITDEITPEFAQALDFISDRSLHYCELRELWRQNIMNASEETLARAKKLIEEHHLTVSDIASPIFKYNLPEMPAKEEKRDTFRANFTDQDTEELLQKASKLARFFGAPKIRIFSYWRVDDPEKAYPHVRERLAKAAALAAKNKIILVLENEHTTNIGTGKELGRILRDIHSPYLRGNWDPGNAAMLNEVPYPDGYNAVRGLFAHMHIKDVKKDPTTGKLSWAPVGGGFIDYRGQFKALRGDNYNGTLSLETHYLRPDKNKIESTRESLEGLFRILNEVR